MVEAQPTLCSVEFPNMLDLRIAKPYDYFVPFGLAQRTLVPAVSTLHRYCVEVCFSVRVQSPRKEGRCLAGHHVQDLRRWVASG